MVRRKFPAQGRGIIATKEKKRKPKESYSPGKEVVVVGNPFQISKLWPLAIRF